MTASSALLAGIRSLNRRKRLWFWFYGVTTLWALAIVGPVMALLFASLGQSAWAEQMSANFDLQYLAELVLAKSALAFTPLLGAMMAVALVAAVAHLFLLGGALHLFWSGEEFSMAAFFQGCGRHFWRFVRLALVSALFYAAVFILNSMLSRAGNKIWGEGSEQTPLVYWSWFRVALLFALCGLVGLVFDYARIRLVATDSTKAFRAAGAAIRFVFSNFGRTARLYVAVWAILLVLLAVYRGVAGIIGQAALSLVVLLFLVRQAMVLARVWVQLLFYSSQAEMYRSLMPIPEPVAVAAAPAPEIAEIPEPTEAPALPAETPVEPEAPPTTPEPEPQSEGPPLH